MNKDKSIVVRVDSQFKEEIEEIFSSLGMNTSQAISIFLKQVQLKKGLPFEIKLPEQEDQRFLKLAREAERGGYLSTTESEEFFNKILNS